MKKKSLLVAILITIAIAVLLTWIFPVSYFQYSLIESAREQVGIFELLGFGSTIMQYFGGPIFYILAIGGFYGVMTMIPGYRNMLEKIKKLFKGREWLCLLTIALLLLVATSFAGLSTALMFVFPLIISIVLVLGYDKVTAAIASAGAVLVGLIGNTIGYGNSGIILAILEIKTSSLWLVRIIIFVLISALYIFAMLKYASKHKLTDSETKEEMKEYVPIDEKKKSRAWPIVIIIDLLILIIVLSQINWEQMFGITWFSTITEKILTHEFWGFALFGKIFSSSLAAFGEWTLTELTALVVMGTIFSSICYWKKPSEFFKGYWYGLKKAFKPAVLVFLAYIVLVVTAIHPTLLTIFKPLLNLSQGLNVFTMSLVGFVTSIFNIEPYYSAASTLPYVMSLITDTATYPLISIIWQSMYGLAMLVGPTSIILVATLSYLNVPYCKWLKAIWKLALGILIILLIVFTIMILL